MPTTAALELRYLFGAHLSDEREHFQTADDVSVMNPKKSAFFDLCQHDENGELVCDADGVAVVRDDIELFQLEGQGHKYLVDLRDGHFEVDGAVFFVEYPPQGKLSVVYFRRRRHHFQGGVEVWQECTYNFGWRCGDKVVTLTVE